MDIHSEHIGKDKAGLKSQILNWADQFNPCIVLDSNESDAPRESVYDLLVAVDPYELYEVNESDSIDTIEQGAHRFFDQNKDWTFGVLSYDLKDKLYDLKSTQKDPIGFPLLSFFKPKIVLYIKDGQLTILSREMSAEKIRKQINKSAALEKHPTISANITSKIDQDTYIKDVLKVKENIQLGDFYEMNYCQEFYTKPGQKVYPAALFSALNQRDKSPFAGYVKIKDNHLLCASPERFIAKRGDKIMSQPIKGTMARGHDENEDRINKESLANSTKDRSENIMIVDLVRNDLSIIAERGSVKVPELCKIYSFEKVHQMISTVEAKISDNIPFWSIIKALFPMGSMTGAPKLSVMKHIDRYEASNRGLYSGSIGYIDPNGDFDFNVVIRSIQYNQKSNYLSFHAGGAIVDASDPQSEYEECALKINSIKELLTKS